MVVRVTITKILGLGGPLYSISMRVWLAYPNVCVCVCGVWCVLCVCVGGVASNTCFVVAAPREIATNYCSRSSQGWCFPQTSSGLGRASGQEAAAAVAAYHLVGGRGNGRSGPAMGMAAEAIAPPGPQAIGGVQLVLGDRVLRTDGDRAGQTLHELRQQGRPAAMVLSQR